MLMPSLVCELRAVKVIDHAGLQLVEAGEDGVSIREQEAVGPGIAGDGDRPVADPPLDPITGDLEPAGQFGHAQPPWNTLGMRASPIPQHAMGLSDLTNRIHRHMAASGRAVPFAGQQGGPSRDWGSGSHGHLDDGIDYGFEQLAEAGTEFTVEDGALEQEIGAAAGPSHL